jgi:hypothetical protein
MGLVIEVAVTATLSVRYQVVLTGIVTEAVKV